MLTEKQLQILLGLFEENKETDLSTLTTKIKESGISTHVNYVRNVMKDLSPEYVNLRGQTIGKRTFYFVEPIYEREVFEKLMRLFFRSDYRLEFILSVYAQEMINAELFEYYLNNLWNIINGWDSEPEIKMKEAILQIVNRLNEREDVETINKQMVREKLQLCKESPLVLYALMFPVEASKEILSLMNIATESYDALAKMIGVQGEEVLEIVTKELSKRLEVELSSVGEIKS